MACPGQPRLARTVPDSENVHSKAGTVAHALLSRAIEQGASRAIDVATDQDRGYADGVQYALDYVAGLRFRRHDLHVTSERYLSFPQNVVAPDRVGGTSDITCHAPATGEVWIVDYKNGTDLVYDRTQLLFYATCAVWKSSWSALRGVYIQPNAYSAPATREYIFTPGMILDFQADIEDAIRRCEAPDAPLIAGDHCKWCKCAPICPEKSSRALAAMGLPRNAAEVSKNLAPADTLGIDRCAAINAQADEIKAWLRSIEQYLDAQAKQGVHVPGHKLVEAAPRRRWNGAPGYIVTQLCRLAGGHVEPKEFMRVDLMPLTDAEKLIVKIWRDAVTADQRDKAAQQAREAMAFLTIKDTTGAVSLVPESDPRPAVRRDSAADFSGVILP